MSRGHSSAAGPQPHLTHYESAEEGVDSQQLAGNFSSLKPCTGTSSMHRLPEQADPKPNERGSKKLVGACRAERASSGDPNNPNPRSSRHGLDQQDLLVAQPAAPHHRVLLHRHAHTQRIQTKGLLLHFCRKRSSSRRRHAHAQGHSGSSQRGHAAGRSMLAGGRRSMASAQLKLSTAPAGGLR